MINKPVKVEWRNPVNGNKMIIEKYPIWASEKFEDLTEEQQKMRQQVQDYLRRNNK